MDTKEKILQAARKEFIKKGFREASMRNIASAVGISATALYRHYSCKEEIFEAVVSPAVRAWEKFADTESSRETETAREKGLDAMWNDNSQTRHMVDLIYGDIDTQRLLFCSSEGTKYADFLSRIVDVVQERTLEFVGELKKNGIAVKDFDPKEMHLILSTQYSILLEIVREEYTYEEALSHVATISEFFTQGDRKSVV